MFGAINKDFAPGTDDHVMFGAINKDFAPETDDPVKWRAKRTAAQCLHYLCLSERLADVWFTFKDSDVRLPAHKFVLSMRSGVFEAMFNGQPEENFSKVHIDDVSSDVMEHVLRFMYSDHAEFNKDNVFSFLYVAKKYELESLHEQCIKNLSQSVDAANVCDIYEKVQGFDAEECVSKTCLEYIWHHAWKIFATESFFKISRKTLIKILESDTLTGNEISTFRAVMKWAECQATSNNVQPTPLQLQEFIGDAIYAVRFPFMPIEEFTEEVEPAGVLSTTDLSVLRRFMQEKDTGLNVEIEKFNCNPRNGGIITETIFNAYPVPDSVPGGCDQNYNILIFTTEDIRLHSMTGPLIKDIMAVKLSVYERPGIESLPPSQETLELEQNWTLVNFSVSQTEDIVFTDEPILMPNTFTYVRIELSRRPGTEQPENVQLVAKAPRCRARRGGRQGQGVVFPIKRVTNMSLIVNKTTVSLTYIPPGIAQMSFR